MIFRWKFFMRTWFHKFIIKFKNVIKHREISWFNNFERRWVIVIIIAISCWEILSSLLLTLTSPQWFMNMISVFFGKQALNQSLNHLTHVSLFDQFQPKFCVLIRLHKQIFIWIYHKVDYLKFNRVKVDLI